MKRLLLFRAGSAIALMLTASSSARANDLKTYSAEYEKNLAGVAQKKESEIAKLHVQYREALDKLLDRVRSTGDLDNTLAMTAEIERFSKEKNVSETPVKIPALQRLQVTYRKQAAAIELANAKQLLAVTTKHDEALDKLQASLLRASELDEATAVRDERKRVAARPEVVGATKLVAATKAGTQPVVGVPSKNLLENPGFETPPSETERVPGWEMAVGKNWKRRNFDPSPQEGKQYFFAGPGAKAELRQTVSVESYRSKIDAGKQAFRFEGHVSSWKIAKDTSQIVVEFLDWQKEAILDVFDSGVKKSAMKWQKIQHEQVAPKGTRFIRVRLIAARNDGKNNDGYFDNISLVAIQG